MMIICRVTGCTILMNCFVFDFDSLYKISKLT